MMVDEDMEGTKFSKYNAKDLGEVFELKDMCKLKYFLGLEVQYEANGKVFVTQAKYARDLIKKAAMDTYLIRCRRAVTTTQSSEPPAQPTSAAIAPASAAIAPALMDHLAVGPVGS
ncbi:hypothetical protein L3X38_016944 [Prunus dulcis]|uniref:Reverse transcriptase Ty1/copia-type domain-containing protein n=1 Tax=Prunus dulcis TaxID=3755 RepID=A0AAD4ZAA4_PRUDU|nr:hypothetical protein L3X38_016944 [Prunus dulcis]